MSKVAAFVVLTSIVTIVVGVGVFVTRNIDEIVREMIEAVGSKVVGSEVRVADLKLDLTKGEGFLSGLTVANPKGFSGGNIFSLNRVSIDIDTGSLFDNVYVIESISVNGIRVLVEQAGSKNNIQALLDLMPDEAESGRASSQKVGNEISLAVSEIVFRDTNVQLDSDVFGENSLTLPDYSLYNLGTPVDGITPEQLATAIAMELAFKVKDAIVGELREFAKQKALSRIKQQIAEKALEGAENLKRLFEGDH